eukprot:m.146239 g.146239  ORF g.146239 m.146239 type:complete len:67 (+) comp38449_c0_seq15:170-370(+)
MPRVSLFRLLYPPCHSFGFAAGPRRDRACDTCRSRRYRFLRIGVEGPRRGGSFLADYLSPSKEERW